MFNLSSEGTKKQHYEGQTYSYIDSLYIDSEGKKLSNILESTRTNLIRLVPF